MEASKESRRLSTGKKLTKKEYNKLVNQIFQGISESLIKGESVKIRDFGTFKLVNFQERNGRNPKTGEKLIVPAKKGVKLDLAKKIKEKING